MKKGQLEISPQQCRLIKRKKVGPSMQVPACGLGGARDWSGGVYPPAEFWTASPRRLNHHWHRGTWAPARLNICLSGFTVNHQPSSQTSPRYLLPSNFISLITIFRNLRQEAMVCSKCLKLSKGTTLATPGVKKKSEMYHGSPASSSSKSATLGQTGIGKVRDHPSVRLCHLRTFDNN